MESDIIVEGFKLSESMHGLRYMWMIGDGDSSVHYSVTINVPYGIDVKKIECSNHAVKCYRSSLEKLVKDNPSFKGQNGLSSTKIQYLAKCMKCAIAQNSVNKDVATLRQDLPYIMIILPVIKISLWWGAQYNLVSITLQKSQD